MAEEPSAGVHPKRSTRRNKRAKVAVGVCFFVVILLLLLLGLGSIIPIGKPKYRIQSLTIGDLNVTDHSNYNPPFFKMKTGVLVTVKNSNFGSYKFRDANLTFFYKGTAVGEAFIGRSSVHIRSKKRMKIGVDLNSKSVPENSNLSSDIASGVLPLNARSLLTGKMEYAKVIKRYKSAKLNCRLNINLLGKAIQRLRCD